MIKDLLADIRQMVIKNTLGRSRLPVDIHNELSDIKNVQKAYCFHSFAGNKAPVDNPHFCAGFTY